MASYLMMPGELVCYMEGFFPFEKKYKYKVGLLLNYTVDCITFRFFFVFVFFFVYCFFLLSFI